MEALIEYVIYAAVQSMKLPHGSDESSDTLTYIYTGFISGAA
jgi:hypothetical protein